MMLRFFNYFWILFLLQSCTGGRFGDFLELSFKNIELEESIIERNKSKDDKIPKNEKILQDSNKILVSENNDNFLKGSNREQIQSKENLKSNEINKRKNKASIKNTFQEKNKLIKRNYEPQSYRVIIILKAVDPSAPSQQFSNALKNSNINFEIERIERFQESDSKN